MPTPVPTDSNEDGWRYSWEDMLLGHWGEEEAIYNGTTRAYYLNTPVYDCREIGMELTINSYEGYPFGDWALFLMDMDGRWSTYTIFKLDKSQGDGRTVQYDLTFDKAESFQALTICPAENGMEQTIERSLLFFCKQAG